MRAELEGDRESRIASTASDNKYLIGVLPGEGVGPEVIAAALNVLQAVTERTGSHFLVEYDTPLGLERPYSKPYSFTNSIAEFCTDVLGRDGTVFSGPAGDRFVYQIRTRFDLFYKLVPVIARPTSADYSPLKAERLEDIDLLIVRENCSGLYFGEWGEVREDNQTRAYHQFQYTVREVDRILSIGKLHAVSRRGQLSVVVKRSGVPAISDLWIRRLHDVCGDAGLKLDILEVDFATYQLVNKPSDFDVIVCPNMFGDVLADCGAVIIGSRGMSYSANYDGNGRAIYQTGHGAAHDIAGTNRANPIGQILSLAMMLRNSFELPGCAQLVEYAVDAVLQAGYRTEDIHREPHVLVGTHEMGQLIARAVHEAPNHV